MASTIRRTLLPVPRPGSRLNGEACSVASPLSKSSSAVQNPLQPSSLSYSSFNSLEYALYRVHNFILGLFSHRSSRSLDRSKPKGQVWKKAFLHFLVFFLVGVFIGLTPFGSSNFPGRIMPQHQTLFFDMIPSAVRYHSSSASNASSDETRLENHTSLSERQDIENISSQELHYGSKEQLGRISSETLTVKPVVEEPPLEVRKLLIVVTPTYTRPFQAYYLNRLAQTLTLVPPPLLWIVVEMNSQSAETVEILRKTGLMYRHLVCNKNITEMRDRNVHQRNVALAHIETHRLDGIVYFADDVNVYSVGIFSELRQIRPLAVDLTLPRRISLFNGRGMSLMVPTVSGVNHQFVVSIVWFEFFEIVTRFGTWKLATLSVTQGATFLNGPVCNGSEIIGWKTDEMTRRFHADISGFAFNSTILWDPKRWHRPILEPIRQLDTVKEKFLVSAFIELVVEEESQMEGLLGNCSSIMVWRLPLESSSLSYPPQWFISRNVEKQLSLQRKQSDP